MDKALLHWVADTGRKYGCDDLKVVLLENRRDAMTVRNGQVDKIEHSVSCSLAIDMFIDGRNGFVYTNNLATQALEHLIREGVETTRMLTPDPTRVLADPSLYYRGGLPDLGIFDENLLDVSPEVKLRMAKDGNAEVAGTNERIISVETRYADNAHESAYLITNGFEGERRCSRVSLNTLVTINGEGGQHPMDGWGEARLRFADVPREGIGRRALERALRKVGQRPVGSGRYTMLVEAPVAAHLLQPLYNAMQGDALQQRMSFLADKMNQPIASPLLHVVDDPLTPGQRGAAYFDSDGVATKRRVLFDHGVLRTFFIDTSNALKLNMAPTTQGIHHTVLSPGTKGLPALIADASKAILVTDFNGGNCDPSTGKFSYGIEGFLIENGVIVQPVSGMNITGDMLTLWRNLADVGNDADPWEADLVPTLVFEDVEFSGV